MHFLRTEGRTRIALPSLITPRTARPGSISSNLPNSAFEPTTVSPIVLSSGDGFASFDAGEGQQFRINGMAIARASDDFTCAVGISSIAPGTPRLPGVDTIRTFRLTRGHSGTVFGEIEGRYLDVTVDGPPSASLAFIWIGEWLATPRGIAPPFVQPNLSTTFSTTETNTKSVQVLGSRAQPVSTRTSLTFANYSPLWFGLFEPIRLYLARGHPVFLMPDVNLQNSVGLVQAAADVPPVKYLTPTLAELSLPLRYVP